MARGEGSPIPLYEFQCEKEGCGKVEEHFVSNRKDKDDERFCDCGGLMRRISSPFVSGQPEYQMQALLGSGDHLKGHFGKEAKRSTKKRATEGQRRTKTKKKKRR